MPVSNKFKIENSVFFCRTRNTIFFIDVKKSEYSCIEAADGPVVESILQKIAESNKISGSVISSGQLAVLESMGVHLERDFLERIMTCMPPVPASRDLFSGVDPNPPIPTMRHICRFLISVFTATILTKFCSFSTVVRRVHSLRGKMQATTASLSPYVMTEIAIYHRLKPFYTSKDRCYFDSIVMLEFLAAAGIFPIWAFGVNTNPFFAHCWTQIEDCVLNDRQDTVAPTHPILTI